MASLTGSSKKMSGQGCGTEKCRGVGQSRKARKKCRYVPRRRPSLHLEARSVSSIRKHYTNGARIQLDLHPRARQLPLCRALGPGRGHGLHLLPAQGLRGPGLLRSHAMQRNDHHQARLRLRGERAEHQLRGQSVAHPMQAVHTGEHLPIYSRMRCGLQHAEFRYRHAEFRITAC